MSIQTSDSGYTQEVWGGRAMWGRVGNRTHRRQVTCKFAPVKTYHT